MKDYNAILLAQLNDIHGPTAASIWPLAPGWWIVLFFILSFSFVVYKKFVRIKSFKNSWRYRIAQELDAIAADTNLENSKKNISRINDILKRRAIGLYGRKESAGLAGRKWLAWLSNRDPSNFNWVKKAEILIEYPYMPEEKVKTNSEQISAIAKATKSWLKL